MLDCAIENDGYVMQVLGELLVHSLGSSPAPSYLEVGEIRLRLRLLGARLMQWASSRL